MSCARLFWGHCVWVWSGRKCNRQNRNDGIFLNFWPLTCKTQTQADLRSPRVKALFRNFLQLFSGFSYLSLTTWNSTINGSTLTLLNRSSESSFLKGLMDSSTSQMSVSLRRSGTQEKMLVWTTMSGMRGVNYKNRKETNQSSILGFLSSSSMPLDQPSGHRDVLQEREKIKTTFCLPEHNSLW